MRVEQATLGMVEIFVCEDVVLGTGSNGIVRYLILGHRAHRDFRSSDRPAHGDHTFGAKDRDCDRSRSAIPPPGTGHGNKSDTRPVDHFDNLSEPGSTLA
jgi:hypothetical protein